MQTSNREHPAGRTHGTTRALRVTVAGVAVAVAVYEALVKPRLLHWGATEAEVRGAYPGATLIPGGERSATMAVTIDAPPAAVWPWLLQMGYGRAGWYSWDHLDNWGRSSAKELHSEWQDVAVGDHLPSMPNDAAWWEVAALEPQRFLGLRASVDLRGRPFAPGGQRPRAFTDSIWGFRLNELPDGRTRLVVSGYWAMQPRWAQVVINGLFLEMAHWVMQRRQFANLKRLVEEHGYETDPLEAPAASEAAETREPHAVW